MTSRRRGAMTPTNNHVFGSVRNCGRLVPQSFCSASRTGVRCRDGPRGIRRATTRRCRALPSPLPLPGSTGSWAQARRRLTSCSPIPSIGGRIRRPNARPFAGCWTPSATWPRSSSTRAPVTSSMAISGWRRPSPTASLPSPSSTSTSPRTRSGSCWPASIRSRRWPRPTRPSCASSSPRSASTPRRSWRCSWGWHRPSQRTASSNPTMCPSRPAGRYRQRRQADERSGTRRSSPPGA